MRGRLTALSVLAGIIVPTSSALAALPRQPKQPEAGAGGIGIRLADAPADSHDPLARSYVVDRLVPGTSISRLVEISNTTSSPADISVYAAAAGLNRGTFAFAAGHSRNELSSWTTVGQDVLHLQPGSKTFETPAITVPNEAPSGERGPWRVRVRLASGGIQRSAAATITFPRPAGGTIVISAASRRLILVVIGLVLLLTALAFLLRSVRRRCLQPVSTAAAALSA